MGDSPDLIRYLNRRSRTAFLDALPQDTAVFRPMDESFSDCVGARRSNPNGPRPETERLKRGSRPRVLEHERAPAALALQDTLSFPMPGSGMARSLAAVACCIGASGVRQSMGQR